MKKVSFGVISVQKGRRVILDESLLQNLEIKEGDPVEVFLDIKEESIVIKKPRSTSSVPPAENGTKETSFN
jgi:bifunctional DNA-binding transcriptional regulator/antitoxin component of YhaV-PrlF toxin-antitoxin module